MATYSVTPSSRSSRITKVVLSLASVLAVAWSLFMRDGEGNFIAPPKVEFPASTATGQTGATPGSKYTSRRLSALVETSRVFASKDPFEPLVESTTPDVATDGTGGKVPTSANKESPGRAATTDESTGSAVTLVDVKGTSQAEVDVAGKTYRVGRGERFAKSFKLLLVDGKCVSMLYGDDQFDICEGERISK
jgi:hypothetical protein